MEGYEDISRLEGYEEYLIVGLMQDYVHLREEWDKSCNTLKFNEKMVEIYLNIWNYQDILMMEE